MKKINHFLTPVLAFVLLFLTCFPVKADGWYFKKTEDHTPPPLDAAQKPVLELDGYYLNQNVPKDDKVIYLTFDAGYENGNVEKIVDTLIAHKATGAFFVLKHFVTANPELIKKMSEGGLLLCNHTATHKDMSLCDKGTFSAELTELESVTRDSAGLEIAKFYRPPEGKYSLENLSWAKEMGYKTIFWSFAYADWDNNAQRAPAEAMRVLLEHTHNGEILLLHPTSATNAAILGDFLTELEKQGYRFGSLSELGA